MDRLRRTDPEFDRLLVAAARSRTKGRRPARVRVPPPVWASLTTEETDRIKAVVLNAVRSGRPLREVYSELGITFPTLRHLRWADPSSTGQ
ncbi:hypothetical protein [Streptomyces endocoffeicus]|uniref:hypothetical protein n=1 Tax=Streptomyces endocoffeicus TaxID=2898945 RepID=UPI001E5D47B0|nr:hypothetical protein [Streptomyces endocoffeicus]